MFCSNEQRANGFWLKQEPFQGINTSPPGHAPTGDDTAANAFSLRCEDGSYIEASNDGEWGNWSPLIQCPSNSYICGIQVQIESGQGLFGDDTALNNADFICCN